jgi:hypothetical protein
MNFFYPLQYIAWHRLWSTQSKGTGQLPCSVSQSREQILFSSHVSEIMRLTTKSSAGSSDLRPLLCSWRSLQVNKAKSVGFCLHFLMYLQNVYYVLNSYTFTWPCPLMLTGCFISFLGNKASSAAKLPNPRLEVWNCGLCYALEGH